MRDVLILAIHLLVTLAKFLRPGGVRQVAAEFILLKHQLLISNRSRRRAPPSRPGEFHPEALTDPYVNLSIHTARATG